MAKASERVTIETTAEGLEPGDVVIIEFTYDPDEIELILVPPSDSREA